MARKWTCPKCNTAKLGPERPKKNASVRFCLACSADSPMLVERVCLSLEAERAKREERAKEKAKKKRERKAAKREARWVVDGLDIQRETKRYWLALHRTILDFGWGMYLPSREGNKRHLDHARARVPGVQLFRRKRDRKAARGHASYWGREVHLSIGTDADRAATAELLLHELCHIALPRTKRGDKAHGHSVEFCELLEETAHRLWGTRAPVPTTGGKQDCYRILDAEIVRQLREKWAPLGVYEITGAGTDVPVWQLKDGQ